MAYFKNVDDLAKSWYPTKEEMERYALQHFIEFDCYVKRPMEIYRTLLRGGISSIGDLHRASVDDIKCMRHVGDTRLAIILEIKKCITMLVEES